MKNFFKKLSLGVLLTTSLLQAESFSSKATNIIFKENLPYIEFGEFHLPLSMCHFISYMERIANYEGYQNSPLIIDDRGRVIVYVNKVHGAYGFDLPDFKKAALKEGIRIYTKDWKFLQDPARDPLACQTQRLREVDFWNSSCIESGKKPFSFFNVEILKDNEGGFAMIISGDLALVISLDSFKSLLKKGQSEVVALKDDEVWIGVNSPEGFCFLQLSLTDFKPLAAELGIKMPLMLEGTPIYFSF